jgi:hypothetical protein
LEKRVFLFVAVLLMFCPSSYAFNIGISPARAEFSGMTKDGYSEGYFLVSTDSPDYVVVSVSSKDNLGSWLSFSSEEFRVRAHEPYHLKVVVVTPIDVMAGNYSGRIELVARKSSEKEGMGSDVAIGALVPVRIEVGGEDVIGCMFSVSEIMMTEEEMPVYMRFLAKNTGNARIMPKVEADVWSSDLKSIVLSRDFYFGEILPGRTEELKAEMTSNLNEGTYKLSVNVPVCGFFRVFDLEVLEKGSLKTEGSILGLSLKDAAGAREIVPVRAEFKNNGETRVIARFEGEVFFEGRLIGNVSSENIYIEPGETITLVGYYSPNEPGGYTVIGKVLYNGKITDELSGSFRVNGNGGVSSGLIVFLNLLVLVLIVVLIVFILGKIKKIRRKRKGWKGKEQ